MNNMNKKIEWWLERKKWVTCKLEVFRKEKKNMAKKKKSSKILCFVKDIK